MLSTKSKRAGSGPAAVTSAAEKPKSAIGEPKVPEEPSSANDDRGAKKKSQLKLCEQVPHQGKRSSTKERLEQIKSRQTAGVVPKSVPKVPERRVGGAKVPKSDVTKANVGAFGSKATRVGEQVAPKARRSSAQKVLKATNTNDGSLESVKQKLPVELIGAA